MDQYKALSSNIWIARVVDKSDGFTEFVGPMTEAQANKFHGKYKDSATHDILLEELCRPSQFVLYA